MPDLPDLSHADAWPPIERTAGGGGPPATLHDVAREAGVSVSTASRALNGSARNVRRENLARVLRAAAKLNYSPDLSAQATATGSTKTAALVVSDIADPYFSAIAAGAIQGAEAGGLIVTMAAANRLPERELQIVTTLRGYRPRAIILAGSRVDDSALRDALVDELLAYQTAGGRVVLVTQPGMPFPTVTVDNFAAAGELASAVVAKGYRRFAAIRAPQNLRTSRDRFEGFLAGLAQSGGMIDDRLVVETEFTHAGGYWAATELLNRGLAGAELVFAVNDVMAIGAMRAFRDAGLIPGRDIAIAGFDDIESAVDVVPALTTVHVPLREMGVRAIELALAADGKQQVVQLPTSVVLRTSTPSR
jgi:LacI family transcriptional regulator